jgi:hypothetical protein
LPEGSVPISPAPDPTPVSDASEKTEEAATPAEKIENNIPQIASTSLPTDVALDESALQRLLEQQSTALRKARLLAPKAQAELSRLEANTSAASAAAPVPEASPDAATTDQNPAPQVDLEKLKLGLEKAVELSPKAVEAMQLAVDHLQRKDPKAAAAPAEEARRILEEIQNAQPEQPQQDQNNEDQKEQKKDDQSQKNDEQQDQNKKKDDGKKSSEQKKDSKDKQTQKDQNENKQDKKNEEQKKQGDQKKDDKQKQDQDKSGSKSSDSKDKKQPSESNSEQPQVSRDRIEDALRKVRERQQEKRERDREMRARIIGRTPVEKDW